MPFFYQFQMWRMNVRLVQVWETFLHNMMEFEFIVVT